jgi:hypothetical protein
VGGVAIIDMAGINGSYAVSSVSQRTRRHADRNRRGRRRLQEVGFACAAHARLSANRLQYVVVMIVLLVIMHTDVRVVVSALLVQRMLLFIFPSKAIIILNPYY